jgi:hypothetical protein
MLINVGLSSQFPSPTVVVGPVGTLVLEGAENSRIILSAIGADEVLYTGSAVFVLLSRDKLLRDDDRGSHSPYK